MNDQKRDVIARCAERLEYFLTRANESAQQGDFAYAAFLADFAEENAFIAWNVATSP